ncbi:MAG: ABC transporter substrate-binding protein [Eubacteriaceae bacterium]|nr:ABC transporter substrate-binding protein [Eubacteriaceae bacterium]
MNSSKSTPQKIFDFLHANILIIIVGIVIITSILSTFAILTEDEEEKQDNKDTVTYEETNKVYLSMDNVSSLNPLSSNDLDTYYISQILYNGLFKLNDNLNIEADLVDSYSTSAKNGTVDIKLRKAQFSDGASLSADDVYFTVNTIKQIGQKSPYYNYVDKIESVYVTGSRELTIEFKDKNDAALDNLVFPIVSQQSYQIDENNVPGTGPYKYYKYHKQRILTLKPNKHYFGGEVKGTIVFKYVKNKDASTGLITADMITAYLNRNADSDADAEDKNLKYTPVISSEAEYLGFNFTNKYLKDKNIRKAIALAIDAENIINENYGGTAVMADSIYYPGFMGTSDTGERYIVDQRQSSELLKEAGLKELNVDGYLVDSKNNPVEFTLVVNKSNGSRVDTARSIADDLQKVGIKVKIKSLSWKSYVNAINNRKYDLYLGGYSFDKQFNLKSLFSKSKLKGFSNTDLTECVNRMEYALTAKKQAENFIKLDGLLAEETPYYCICYKTYGFITVKHFESKSKPTFFNIYRDCNEWVWKKAVSVKTDEK